jgi:hypothetical protein
MTGQRTRFEVTSREPLPAATAARMSVSLDSSVGVTPGFQWKICRFQPAERARRVLGYESLLMVVAVLVAPARRAAARRGA